MIERANKGYTQNIKEIWKQCFLNEDPKYTDYFFKNIFQPEECLIAVEDNRVVSCASRIPHAVMLHGRSLMTSMIVGVATLPRYRKQGFMHEIMDIEIDAINHSELVTLIQAYDPRLYEPFGFRTIYNKHQYHLTREDVPRITNDGCSINPSASDMLSVYALFVRRFDGYYIRDVKYFENLKNEIAAQGGKIVGYYDENDQIQGYATLIPHNRELEVEECIYMNTVALYKLINVALQQRQVVNLKTSAAEKLEKLFPNASFEEYGFTMARLNNAELFNRLYKTNVKTVEEAFSISGKPLYINEFA